MDAVETTTSFSFKKKQGWNGKKKPVKLMLPTIITYLLIPKVKVFKIHIFGSFKQKLTIHVPISAEMELITMLT